MSKSKARRFADLLGVSSIFNEDATEIRATKVVDETANTDLKSFTTNLDSEKASNTYVNTLLANTNAYIASVQSDVNSNKATERSALANTNAYIASISATERSALANTNAYIAKKYAVANVEAKFVSNTYAQATFSTTTDSLRIDMDGGRIILAQKGSERYEANKKNWLQEIKFYEKNK